MKKAIFLTFLLTCSVSSQTTWTEMNVPGNSYNTCIFFTNSLTGYICNEADNIIKTTNAGQNWFIQYAGVGVVLRSIVFVNVQTGYAVGGSICLKTTNSGQNWNQFALGYGPTEKVVFVNENTGFILVGDGKLLKTTNSGSNWFLNYDTGLDLEAIFFVNQNTGYMSWYSALYKTTNQGISWNSLPVGAWGFRTLFFVNESIGFMGGDHSVGPFPPRPQAHIYRTTNAGLNWVMLNMQPNVATTKAIHFINQSLGYVGFHTSASPSIAFLKTFDGGVTWFNQLPGNPYRITSIFFINDDTGFITGSQSFKTTNGGSTITFVNNETGSILKYSLNQNFPNPFNPVTNIKFDISKKSNVKIMIYDILGKEITVLVNEEMNGGTYEVNWDASAYPSGVYFYKLITDDFTESKKMVLVK